MTFTLEGWGAALDTSHPTAEQGRALALVVALRAALVAPLGALCTVSALVATYSDLVPLGVLLAGRVVLTAGAAAAASAVAASALELGARRRLGTPALGWTALVGLVALPAVALAQWLARVQMQYACEVWASGSLTGALEAAASFAVAARVVSVEILVRVLPYALVCVARVLGASLGRQLACTVLGTVLLAGLVVGVTPSGILQKLRVDNALDALALALALPPLYAAIDRLAERWPAR